MSTFLDSTKRPPLPSDSTRTGQPAPAAARNTTLLTSDCEFKGAMAFSGELQLHGRVEGTIESEGGTLTVGEEAMVKGEVKVNDLLVYGKIQGNVYATGRVELRGKAEIYGDIHSNRLAMDDGVVFVGKSNALSGKNQPTADFAKMFTRLGSAAKANSTGKPGAGSD